jgi:type IV pilus assembly protein PilQ
MNIAEYSQRTVVTRWLWPSLYILWALSSAAFGAELTNISFSSLPGDRVQVELKLSEPATKEPLSFIIDNPARIALDFPDTQLKVDKKSVAVGVGAAHSISAVEANGRTRVVLNLVEMVPYDVKLQGDTVLVSLGKGAPALADQTTAMTSALPGAGRPSIEDVDFHRGPSGEGRVLVRLSDPSMNVNIREEGGKILVDFINANLPERFDRRLDVVDFATPVTEIDTFVQGNGARMVITPTGFYDHLAYQSDDLLTIELKPLTKEEEEAAKKEKFGYVGERLSLNFQNIEVRAVLQLIADFTGLNMVASDTVTGNVTLRLKNVPWDQALDIILKSKGLGMRQVGNVIMVAPQEEIAAREKLELEAQQQIQELAPLSTEFIEVNYAKATDIATLIKTEANNLLSERGNVSVDDRTNTLIVQDTGDRLAAIRQLIEKLDIPVRQVLIESRIVIADEDFSKELGVKFGLSTHDSQDSQLRGDFFNTVGGKLPGDTTFQPGPTSFNTGGVENYIVDLPAVAPAGALGLAVGRIGNWLLQLELSALQAENRGEVISSPRVITANQQEAFIEQGTEIPYQEASSSGATSVSFKKAVLSLTVVPQITPDDRVIMDLTVNKDAVGEVFAGVPSIDTREVSTQVIVDNGETVVLGGIYEITDTTDIRRVPFFGELPYVGWLFKNTLETKDKTELLIFVTPKILKETLTL